MNTLLSYHMFRKMRDEGKFSKKFEGRHSYFLYLEPIDDNKNLEVFIKDDNYMSPPPAPRYRKETFCNKYFNTNNLPNKYHVNQNIQ